MSSSILEILQDSFVKPFLLLERNILYLCAFLGSLAQYAIWIYLGYALTDISNLSVIAGFTLGLSGLMGMFGLPLAFMLFRRSPHWWRSLVLLSFAMIGMAGILSFDVLTTPSYFVEGFFSGIFYALPMIPFWVIYHCLMVRLTTQENRGHEVAIAGLMLKAGAVAGTLISAVFLIWFPELPLPLIGCILGLLCTCFLIFPARKFVKNIVLNDPARPSWLYPFVSGIRHFWPLNLITIWHSMMSSLISFLSPIWLKLMGFSAIASSSLMLWQLLMRLSVSPLAGHWFKQKQGHELTRGSAAYIIGWLPWLFPVAAFSFLISGTLWSAATHLMNTGLEARWYDLEKIENMAAREFLLSIGRLIAIGVMLSLMAISPNLFVIALMCFGAGFIMIVKTLLRREETKEANIS